LEVREAILAEEQERGLHPPNGRFLSTQLYQTRVRVDRINGERATEVGRQLQLVIVISNALVDLGMLPIQDIPQLSKSVREVLPVAGLILERLQEALASSASSWD
jgi:hypothetical protein